MIDGAALRAELFALGVSSDVRRRAGSAWLDAARLEHASIASFHRFALQLLRLGAPPDLLTACAQAAADEVRHARLSFAVASVYLGEPLGPGPLPIPVESSQASLAEVLCETIRDGCVIETLGAAEAEHAASRCRVTQLRAVLQAIASDEARHAELAWCFASWALTSQPALRASARAAFERAQRQHAISSRDATAIDDDLAEHGRLSAAQRHALFARTLDVTIMPAARELLR